MVWSSGVVPLAGVAVGGVARAGVAVEGCRWLRAWEGGGRGGRW